MSEITTDRVVDVTAYVTDEHIGRNHWRASQYGTPIADETKPALLVVCEDAGERASVRAALAVAFAGPQEPLKTPQDRLEEASELWKRACVHAIDLIAKSEQDGTDLAVAVAKALVAFSFSEAK